MKRVSRTSILLAVALSGSPVFAADGAGEGLTFSKDVAPIIQEKCQDCHRPNGIAPFSLMNFRQAKGWAKMIREVVLDGRMPPWHADPAVGTWSNDMSLSKQQKDIITAWIDGGAAKGDDADLPAPREFFEDWGIGQPDIVFEMPEEVTIPATGVMAYQHYVLPTNFEEDMYVSSMELKPSNPRVVHHIIMFVQDPTAKPNEKDQFLGIGGAMLDVFAPGTNPFPLTDGQARKIPKGSKLVWQVHYTPTGRIEKDRSKFGMVLAKGPVTEEIRTATVINAGFRIPANEANYKVEAEMNFPDSATIYSFTPHMHYRGKAMDFVLKYPDGREELACSIPRYDFNWQLDYRLAEPLRVPKGTTVKVVAHFDNSDKNPYNPDPTKSVTWGEQTWEEMMMGGMFLSWGSGEAPAASTD